MDKVEIVHPDHPTHRRTLVTERQFDEVYEPAGWRRVDEPKRRKVAKEDDD